LHFCFSHRRRLNSKGYLGPIGDDLPSLIPLVFALVIFFSSFYSTVEAYNTKTVDFENDIAVVQVSASLRGTGYVSSLSDFEKTCNALNVRQPLFSSGLIPLEEEIDIFDLDSQYILDAETNNPFKCSNTDKVLTEGKALGANIKIVSRTYPLVLEKNFTDADGKEKTIVIPVKLVVVAWRE